jgi:hypothetical protein
MKLKHISGGALVAATALAIAFGATTARADYNGGGPIMKGKQCWVATNGLDHGFWKACPKPAKKAKKSKKKNMKK